MGIREDIVDTARSLVETPFHHGARVPGIGVDCVGVIVLVGYKINAWPAGFDVLPYPEVPNRMYMRTVCRKYLKKIAYNEIGPGDVVLTASEKFPQHLGVVGKNDRSGIQTLIHASRDAFPPRVVEQPLMFTNGLKFVEAYSFPGVI